MPSVKLSPIFNDGQLASSTGQPLSGGKIYWYIAGTTTPVAVYSEQTGSTPQTNPVVLNARGEPTLPIWLATGQNYKAVLTDSLDNIIRTVDYIAGINDTATPVISEWVLYGGSASFINSTQFSVTGDLTAVFTPNRRIKATVSGGDCYATINTSIFGAGITTVTAVNDSVVLDSGLNTVYYGFLDPTYPSFDSSGINAATKTAFQVQTFTAFTTGGSSGSYTLTPVPAVATLIAGHRFRVKFHATGGLTNNLNVSGLGNIAVKQYSGAYKVAAEIIINRLHDVEYDGTDFVILNPVDTEKPGIIKDFGGATAPFGYIACPVVQTDVLRTDFPGLFDAIGTRWNGGGTPGTHFGLPWFPGDYTRLQAGVGIVGSQTAGEVIAHDHDYVRLLGVGAFLNAGFNYTGSNATTTSTGGAFNKAAGHRVLFCVKY
jgi:hypothetical protein